MAQEKLTDHQYILLATAAQRRSGHLMPPVTAVKGSRAGITKAIRALLQRALAKEVPARTLASAWREEKGQRFGVIITATGRAAVLAADGKERATPAERAESAATEKDNADRANSQSGVANDEPASPRTKQALLIELLRRSEGASLDELVAATGWLPHTTRAALTGLRKKGHQLSRRSVDGVSRYTITAAAPQ